MNKKDTHVVTGMSRDMSVTRFNPNLVVDARNIRITTQGDKATLLIVTNEKGTKEISLPTPIKGCIIGNCVIDNTLVLFTVPYDGDDRDDDYPDYIYKITNINTNIPVVTPIFKGALGFSSQHPIETTVVIENENIKKVYWVDGINQPRMININKEYQDNDNDAFDFCQTVEFNHSFTVEKNTTGGEFPVGTIQYCFSYFNLNGQETNLIETSPLYYLSPADRGLPADSRCTNSFLIKIGNADTSFDYVRLYSIIRTSENATPNCRIVGDYKITDDIIIVDNGTIGSTIDPTALYFIGGKSIIAGTLDQKDNTLFLGNLKETSPKLSSLSYKNSTLGEYIKNNLNDEIPIESVYFDHTDTPKVSSQVINDNEYWNSAEVAGREFYSDTIDNTKSSRSKKGFKSHEGYRLGFVAQKETGEWSDVVWVGDYDELCMPGEHFFKYGEMPDHSEERVIWRSCKRTLGFRASLPEQVVTLLRTNHFRRVAPVVVFPQDVDKKVVCQGLLFGTVFNINDRLDNSPFVQSDWRARLDYSFEAIDNEIQTMPIAVNPILPTVEDTSNFESKVQEFKDLYGDFYYRDANIIDFYSPDIEATESITSQSLENTNLRIVGFSNLGYWIGGGSPYVPEHVVDSYMDIQTRGIYDITSTQYPSIFKSLKLGSSVNGEYQKLQTHSRFSLLPQDLCFPGLLDGYANLNGTYGNAPEKSSGSSSYLYLTYLWHRSGSLNNQNPVSNSQEIRTAQYTRKCISEIQYGLTTYLQPSEENFSLPPYNVEVNTPKVFDSDQISALQVPIDSIDGNTTNVLYYGNVDKVHTPSLKTYETLINGSNVTLDFSNGYPITYIPLQNSGVPTGGISEYNDGKTKQLNWPKVITPVNIGYISRGNDTALHGKDPVRIKYKTTKHAVFSLKKNSLGGSSLAMSGSTIPMVWQNQSYTGFNQLKGIDSWVNSSSFSSEIFPYTHLRDSVLVGELYRDFTPDQLAARFGGTSEEALATNKWVMCGDPVNLESGQSATLLYKEGDTYIGRYDCLKTYPFTQEDQNSIVSIYSTELESRVNLDLRYDKNRGLQDNTLITPQNFNLFNRAGYDQTNQFFTYQSLNTDRYNVDYFPNMVTWSLEKSFGEDVDTWTSMPLTSTLNLDGDKGGVTELVTWNDNIFAFQKDGFAQLLFNSRVQIPVSDGQPIEITNGLKMSGKRYISENIGCFNKWSVCTTPLGIYFIDDVRKALYNFNGQLSNLSQQKGFETWTSEHCNLNVWNPELWENIVTFYDEINRDIYFVSEEVALVYSEKLGNFISFLDYDKVFPMVNIDNDFYTFKSDGLYNSVCWKMWAGDYNYFFDDFKPFWLTFVSNIDPTVDKIFDNLEWRSTVYTQADGDAGVLKPLDTFDSLRIWNEYQDTQQSSLFMNIGSPSPLKKKFNVFRAQIPRDKRAELTRHSRDRIRSPWAYIQLSKTIPNKDMMIFNDMSVGIFE